jgi:hypothetical protein
MSDVTTLDKLAQQSAWYGERARFNRSFYVTLKGAQIVFAAAIPVVAVAGGSILERSAAAILGALVGIFEGFLQLGQYQQNWLLYRATREALKREVFLHNGKAGPYFGIQDIDTLLVERSDAIISGENSKWILLQQQQASTRGANQQE